MAWLPDPVLREDEDGPFKIYSEVNGKDTTEADRPTYTSATTRLSLGKKRKVTTKTTDPSFNIILYHRILMFKTTSHLLHKLPVQQLNV